MATQQTSSQRLTLVAGAVLLAVGFLILFSNLDEAATRVAYATGNPGGLTLGMLPVALALLHGLQSYPFDHAGFLSAMLQFLVSFWPLILILAGAFLLRDVLRGRYPAYKARTGSREGGAHA